VVLPAGQNPRRFVVSIGAFAASPYNPTFMADFQHRPAASETINEARKANLNGRSRIFFGTNVGEYYLWMASFRFLPQSAHIFSL
jgi:hypothetical protein